jgi:predicted nucleic acid-binding protein
MSTTTVSLDANLIVSVLNQELDFCDQAQAAINKFRKSGRVVVSGPVYAELLGLPSRTQLILDEFFTAGGIEVDWDFDEAVWQAAGIGYQSYVRRRLAQTGQLPRRILADFLIGAHALVRGYTLLTMDGRLYRASFPDIRIELF